MTRSRPSRWPKLSSSSPRSPRRSPDGKASRSSSGIQRLLSSSGEPDAVGVSTLNTCTELRLESIVDDSLQHTSRHFKFGKLGFHEDLVRPEHSLQSLYFKIITAAPYLLARFEPMMFRFQGRSNDHLTTHPGLWHFFTFLFQALALGDWAPL